MQRHCTHARPRVSVTPVIDKTSWSRFIDATSEGVYNSVIAERIGVDPATIGRWRTGAVDPKPRQVVAYARAFGQSPIAALIAAGYLAEDEVGLVQTAPRAYTLDDFSTVELAEEVAKRLTQPESYEFAALVGEASERFNSVDHANVGGDAQDVPKRRRDAALAAHEGEIPAYDLTDQGYDGA